MAQIGLASTRVSPLGAQMSGSLAHASLGREREELRCGRQPAVQTACSQLWLDWPSSAHELPLLQVPTLLFCRPSD